MVKIMVIINITVKTHVATIGLPMGCMERKVVRWRQYRLKLEDWTRQRAVGGCRMAGHRRV